MAQPSSKKSSTRRSSKASTSKKRSNSSAGTKKRSNANGTAKGRSSTRSSGASKATKATKATKSSKTSAKARNGSTRRKASPPSTKPVANGAEARERALPPEKVSGAPAVAAAGQAALAGTRAAGRAAVVAAKRVKTPLAVGGGAAAGIIGGLALRNRTNGSRFGSALRNVELPFRDGKLDLDAVASAAESVESFGKQAGTIATALRAQSSKK
jgi:hypothetical protein